MSKKQSGSKAKALGGSKYRPFKVLCAVTILVACSVVCIGGVRSGASTIGIFYRCLAVTALIGITFGMVIKVVASCEETRGG